ncbi:MAG: ABC transporter permease subunit [candidate division Zixibacteria bacterium]|nr:ABC transporter permease subunit [candidate division Zixibacteria bacterium]
MKLTLKVGWYSIRDVLRGKWALVYLLFFFVTTAGLFQLEVQPAKVTDSLISIVLFLIPLVSLLFGSMYVYNSREFVELLLSQPVRRWTVFLGMYLGLTLSLVIGFVVGILAPYLIFGALSAAQAPVVLTLALVGSALTAIFVGLAFFVSTWIDDKSRGLALAIGIWLFCALVYDGVVLLVAYAFADYPLEAPMLSLMFSNPVDLARLILLLKADMAALMGYTGAVFTRFLGSGFGFVVASLSLVVWTVSPVLAGLWRFQRKDF